MARYAISNETDLPDHDLGFFGYPPIVLCGSKSRLAEALSDRKNKPAIYGIATSGSSIKLASLAE